jgi:hypothetical protein
MHNNFSPHIGILLTGYSLIMCGAAWVFGWIAIVVMRRKR